MWRRKDSTLQAFLIRNFILVLAFVAVSESLITLFMNRYYFSVMRMFFFKEVDISGGLSSREIAGFLVILILQIAIGALRGIVSPGLQQICDRGLERLNYLMIQALPQEMLAYTTDNMPRLQAVFLFLFLLVAVIIMLFPYVIAAITYAKLVVEEVRAIEARRDAQKQEFDRKRNLMLSDIAHDLRTPITTIYGYSKAIMDGMVTEGKQQEYLMAIYNKSARMSDLTNLLFEYVKLDSEGFALEKEELDLSELLRENAALFFPDIEEAGMELSVDIPEKKERIVADRMQLSRCVTNLLVNAMRHNPPGTKIELALRKQAGIWLVIVADTGEEIPEKIKDHLFDPFSKGDNSRKSGKGSGLGLSIVDKVVQMHDWQLKLEQPYGKYQKAFVITISNN